MSKIYKTFKEIGLESLATYVETAVDDPQTVATLISRAQTFEVGSVAVPCVLQPDLIFDLGSRQLNQQTYASVLDLGKSGPLVDLVSRKLGYLATPEETTALFLVTRTLDSYVSAKFDDICISYEETVFLFKVDQRKHRVQMHSLSRDGVRSVTLNKGLGAEKPSQESSAQAVKNLNRIIPVAEKSIRGLNDTLIAWDGTQWGSVHYAFDQSLVLEGVCKNTNAFCILTSGGFRPSPVALQALSAGLGSSYTKYEIPDKKLMLPGLVNPCNNLGHGRTLHGMAMTLTEDVGGGGAGGGGGGSTTNPALTSSGTGICLDRRDYVSCANCCNTQALAIGATGAGGLTTILGVAVASTTPFPPLFFVVCAVAAVIIVATVIVVNSSCISECEKVRPGRRTQDDYPLEV